MLDIIEHLGSRGARCCCFVCRQPYEVFDRFVARDAHAGNQCPTCKNLPNNPPTQSLLHQVYNYEVETGLLTYKRDFARRFKGESPTTPANTGYLVLTLDKTYLAHKIIWLMQTGNTSEFVDHVNHVRTDNRWTNLREVTCIENTQNKSVNMNNTTGYMGVSLIKKSGKYRAYINVGGKPIHLGVFTTPEEAQQARLAADQQYGFHPNHGMS